MGLSFSHGDTFDVEAGPESADPSRFDAVVVPGGYSPDKVRTDARLVALVKETVMADKPVAAICHAGWVLAEADVVRDRTVTSYHSIRTGLVNAGATWVDEEVVVDGPLITSRTPADLDAFCDQILKRPGVTAPEWRGCAVSQRLDGAPGEATAGPAMPLCAPHSRTCPAGQRRQRRGRRGAARCAGPARTPRAQRGLPRGSTTSSSGTGPCGWRGQGGTGGAAATPHACGRAPGLDSRRARLGAITPRKRVDDAANENLDAY
jgi:protease I